jgi:cytochrome c oxidase subunit 4
MTPTHPRNRSGEVVPCGVCLAVWGVMLVLLAATIAVAEIRFTSFSVAINLLIATAKAALTLLFFMHLRYEGRFLKVMLGLAIGALTAIILLTFSDVWFRGR